MAPEVKLRKKLIDLKATSSNLLASINSVYYTTTLEYFEVETLVYLINFIDDVLLDKLDTVNHRIDHIMCARLIEFEMILKASKNKIVQILVRQIKELITF